MYLVLNIYLRNSALYDNLGCLVPSYAFSRLYCVSRNFSEIALKAAKRLILKPPSVWVFVKNFLVAVLHQATRGYVE